MERETLEQHLSNLNGAQRTYPFGPDPLVFKVMNKMFAYISEKEGISVVTVKCIPFDGAILAEEFEAIAPGYHMNKKHWITISLTDEIPDDMLIDLVNKSYELVVSKLTRALRDQLAQQAPKE
ncbi:MAG: MmcQ/YjbR family DNA-binding protein [Cyanobacteria bacterium J06649_5]